MHPTRRDFLASGILGFSAALIPSFLIAEDPPVSVDIPFLLFDCVGGAAFPANFFVGGEGGKPLGNYSRLGFDARKEDELDRSFGLPMAAKGSSILRGMKQAASREALAKLRLGSFCHFALDDQAGNALSSIALVYAASRKGRALNTVLASANSASGGNSVGPQLSLMPRPTAIARIEDLVTAVGFGAGTSLAGLPKPLLVKYGATLERLNRLFLEKHSAPKTASKPYEEIRKTIEQTPSVDPRASQEVAPVYGLNAQSNSASFEAVSAAVVRNVLEGNSGPGVISIGGCDYHDRGIAVTEAKDLEIGISVGRAVETAHRLKRPLFFQLLTDGGVGAEANSRIWRGDDGSKCMTVIGHYDPKGAADYAVKERFQIGYFTDGQGAERGTLIGDASGKNGENIAYAVAANYLGVAGRAGEFPRFFGDRFTTEQLKSVLVFGG